MARCWASSATASGGQLTLSSACAWWARQWCSCCGRGACTWKYSSCSPSLRGCSGRASTQVRLSIQQQTGHKLRMIFVAVGQSMMMLLWGNAGNVPMHMLHFGYPLGATVGPFIASFFTSTEVLNKNVTSAPHDVNTTTTTTEAPRFADGSRIEIAYFIAGAYVIANAVIFVGFQTHKSAMKSAQYNVQEEGVGYCTQGGPPLHYYSDIQHSARQKVHSLMSNV